LSIKAVSPMVVGKNEVCVLCFVFNWNDYYGMFEVS
jgi:hypothetical protein